MGAGKSHLIDCMANLMGLLQGATTLKVTYNYEQSLRPDIADIPQKSHTQCLLTRIVLATRLLQCKEVAAELENKGCIQEGVAEVARYLHEEYIDKPILVAVDELQLLVGRTSKEDSLHVGQEILSILRRICEEVNTLRNWDSERACLALVTALPTLDLTTASKYAPLRIDPMLLTEEGAEALLHQLEATDGRHLDEAPRHAVLALSGGHPRSLVVLFHSAAKRMPFDVVALRHAAHALKLRAAAAVKRPDVEAVIKASYMQIGDWVSVVEATDLFKASLLVKVESGNDHSSGNYVIPPVFTTYVRLPDHTSGRDWLSLMYSVYTNDASKDLETIS
eukprot:6474517-Amphidinium_carterae.1